MLASNDLTCGNDDNDGFRRDTVGRAPPMKAIDEVMVSKEEYSSEGNEDNDVEDDMMLRDSMNVVGWFRESLLDTTRCADRHKGMKK